MDEGFGRQPGQETTEENCLEGEAAAEGGCQPAMAGSGGQDTLEWCCAGPEESGPSHRTRSQPLRCLLPDIQRLGPGREAAQRRRPGIYHSVRSGAAAAGGGYKSAIPERDPRIREELRNDAGQPGMPVAAPVAKGKERLRQVARWRLSGLRILRSSR